LITDQDQVRDLSPAILADADGVGVALTLDVVPLLVVLGELALVLVVTRWGAGRLSRMVDLSSSTRRPLLAWAEVSLGISAIAALIVAGSFLVTDVTGIGSGFDDERAAVLAFVAMLIPLLALTLGVSVVAAVESHRVALEAELGRQREDAARTAARVHAVLGHEQRRLARSLHADVQATINAGGLMLDRADREGAVTSELIDDVAGRIATSVERFLGGGASTQQLAVRLAEVRALWSGVCTITVDLDDTVGERIDADTVTRELVVDLIAEACANAVVHGGASEVRILIVLAGREVGVEVIDDGVGPDTEGVADSAGEDASGGPTSRASGPRTSGLGTAVLRASCTSFSLEVGAGGGRLHAVLPLG